MFAFAIIASVVLVTFAAGFIAGGIFETSGREKKKENEVYPSKPWPKK